MNIMPLSSLKSCRIRFNWRLNLVGLWLAFAFSGCKNTAPLSELPVYDEPFQRTYFEAQNQLAKGDLELAYGSFSACLEMEPEESALHFDLAKIDLRLGRYEAALEQLNAACSFDNQNRWFREFRAEAELELGDVEGALEDLDFVLQQRVGDVDWLYEWSFKVADAGFPEAAIDLCDRFEKLTPGDAEVALQRLYFLELSNDYEGVYFALEQAVQLHPDVVEFQLQWAQMLRLTGQEEKAFDVLTRIVNEDPSNGMAQLDLAHIYTAMDQVEQAQEALLIAFASEDVIEDEKYEILIQYFQIAAIDTRLLGPLEALLKAALDQHPTSGRLLTLTADFEQSLGRLEEARFYLKKALKGPSASPMEWTNLIALDAELNDIEAMDQHALEALDRFPLQPNFAYFSALAALELGEIERAIETIRRGLGVVVDLPELEAQLEGMLGDALYQVGQSGSAAEAYERSLRIFPDNPMVLNNHAYYLALEGKQLERALECSTRLLDLVPDDANFMDTHAWVLYQLGDFAAAQDFMTQALMIASSIGPTFLEHDGDIRWAMGDRAGAVQSWKQALELGGDAEALEAKIKAAS